MKTKIYNFSTKDKELQKKLDALANDATLNRSKIIEKELKKAWKL